MSDLNELHAQILALSALHQRQKDALKLIDQEIAILFWTSDDGETLRDGQPEDSDAPIRFIEAWKTLRAALAETPDVSMVDKWKMEQFSRGYYCAVACYLKENCLEGHHNIHAGSLFRQGGGWEHADPEDLEIFRKHGLIPTLQPDHQK